jgi:hypothetical protein
MKCERINHYVQNAQNVQNVGFKRTHQLCFNLPSTPHLSSLYILHPPQEVRYMCAVTHDALSNASPSVLIKPSGAVVTLDCYEK